MNALLPRLADFIVAHTDWITERWLVAVERQSDMRAPEHLTRQQLIDHLPQLCQDLGHRLRHEGMSRPQTEEPSAKTHGRHRWEQRYDIDELIRESSLLREVIVLDCLEAFRREEPQFDAVAQAEAEAIIHPFFADAAVEAARQFAADRDRALHAVEQNSRAMLESALDGIIVMAADGRVREWNPAAEKLFGYNRADAIGRELASLIIPPELRDRHRHGLAHYLQTQEGPLLGRRIEVPAIRADQSQILVELAITPFSIDGERLFAGSIRDITARRAAEEASQRLAAIVESSGDAILTTDLQGAITSWNEGARQLFEYTPEEVMGRSVLILMGQEEEGEDAALMQRIRNAEGVRAFETKRRRKNGETVPVSLTISPIFDQSGQVVGASRILRDISLQKQTEEELRRQKEAAETANQAKDRFLATLSHELRTPLNPVLMWACAKVEEHDLDADVREGLRMICRNVAMEARLIDDLLDLTRVARGKLKLDLQPCEADELLQHALEIVRSQFRAKRLRVSLDLAASDHRICADPIRVEQVFWNLLNNAQKFTPEDSEIAVRSYDAAPGVLALQVCDSGAGIAPEMVPRLFRAFEQGSASATGLGLGLAICHAIMELHGGRIVGANRGDATGAVFTVEFQRDRALVSDTPAVVERQGASSRKLRILIVEDHENTALVMQRLLKREGHQVQIAANVRDAIQTLHSKAIDLLVSDLGLPDGNGFQVMRELSRVSDAKGIAVSGYGMDEDLERSRQAGFSAHLIKPINATKLKEAIEQVTAD